MRKDRKSKKSQNESSSESEEEMEKSKSKKVNKSNEKKDSEDDDDEDVTSDSVKKSSLRKSKSKDSKSHDNTLKDVDARIRELEALVLSLRKEKETIGSERASPRHEEATTSALIMHKEVTEAETKIYERLKNVVATDGPKFTITPTVISKATAFSSPLKIRTLNKIPSLFSIHVTGSGEGGSNVSLSIDNQPGYLRASMKAFEFGVTEVRFVMKSVNFPYVIDFSPNDSSEMGAGVLGALSGPVNLETSRTDYVFKIFETLFLIYMNSQFVLSDVEMRTKIDQITFSGDMISTREMMNRQYVDQDIPLLPAAGFNNQTRYLAPLISDMFAPPHHRMVLGEVGRETFSQRKIFKKVGVVTDQFTAATNDLYLTYLRSRAVDEYTYILQHKVLTFQEVSIKIDKPSVFQSSLVPMWRRDESDGCLLLYALDINRQQKYLNHLTELLASINLVSFASMDEIAQTGPRRDLRDATIQQILDNVLSSGNHFDFFRALALDLSSTWVDCEFEVHSLGTGPLNNVFKVFSILLWYCYFPSIARDNSPTLMYELFLALEELERKKTDSYISDVGFCERHGVSMIIGKYPKELYLTGEIVYPLLDREPSTAHSLFRRLHSIIVGRRGEIERTHDAIPIQTPRMSDVRRCYQPYRKLPAMSNTFTNAENRNEFAEKLKMIMSLMMDIIESYKKRFREISSRTAFGTSDTSVAQLIGLFSGYTSSILAGIGIRGHAEMYVLRDIGANSIYVPDCQNFGYTDLSLRPQVIFESDVGRFHAISQQRLNDVLPFELPLFLFLSLRGTPSLAAITPPDAHVQFRHLQNMQEEGILCGDVIRYVNNLKFGDVGVFNREALGISNIITAARADRIFGRLAELSALAEFKELFNILINDVSHKIDGRAINFRICLQPYGQVMFDERIIQPDRSLYGQDLRLGRPLLDDIMTLSSSIFVPETSPIALYTNGLFVTHAVQGELNPFETMDPEMFVNHFRRIVLWKSSMIQLRVKHETRFVDEMVLEIPNSDGTIDVYRPNSTMPRLLIIITAATGPISVSDYDFLLSFFELEKISFLLPELMVIVNREMVTQAVTEDVALHSQMKDVLTGLPNRRVGITFGDTISKPYRLTSARQKLKFLYPISDLDHRDVILRGMTDLVTRSPEFSLGYWESWAYGESNSKFIKFVDRETPINGYMRDVEGTDGYVLIKKTELGVVNMNNEVNILVTPEYILEPEVLQDYTRAHVGIYIN